MERRVVVEFPGKMLRDAVLKVREVKARGYGVIDVFVRWTGDGRGRVVRCDVKRGNSVLEGDGGFEVYRIYYETPNKAFSGGDVLCELLLMLARRKSVGLENVLVNVV